MKSNADKHGMKSAAKRELHEHHDHHAHMAADFRKQFWTRRSSTWSNRPRKPNPRLKTSPLRK
jgi:hypothetical protein